jgi:hypothetical protein
VQVDIIAHYHAAWVSVILAHVIQLERWSCGLSFMLEKTLRVTLVSKLQAILLMEADFNASNKIEYGVRMMQNVCDHCLMPKEIYSKKNPMADNRMLTKTLFYDMMLGIVAGITKLGARVGERVAKNTKLK